MELGSRLGKILALETQIQELAQASRKRRDDVTLQRTLNEALLLLAQERALELERVNQLYQENVRALEFHRKRMAVTVHDLKAPITISLLNLELLEMEEDPEQARYYVTGMRRELEFMLDTIASLLELERASEGAPELRLEPVPLRALVANVMERMAILIHDKPELKLINEIPPEFPPVLGDPHKLTRVFNNLFANAIKYTDAGTIRVSAEVKTAKKVARVTLSDTGVGIEKERIASLFSYYQGDQANPESSGIGLAFVKQVMDAHEGRVWLESVRGRGTKVFLELRLAGGEV